MMDYFQYPKEKHARAYKFQSTFKNYSTYKGYLRREFRNVCVYCRLPDTLTVAPHFSVDHYKPKSKFSGLECEYTNLFYCCSRCNPRKNDYWPATSNDPNFVNPCDHSMASHLRFDKNSGEVSGKSRDGDFMITVLELNDPTFVTHRNLALVTISALQSQIEDREKLSKQLDAMLSSGQISDELYQKHKSECLKRLNNLLLAKHKQTGEVPAGPLPKRHLSYLSK